MADQSPVHDTVRCLSDNELSDVKRRKQRRRRGKNPRFRPYNTLSPEEKMAKDGADGERSERRRSERLANGKAMAPFNTTQFLLEDREARAEAELEAELQYEAKERKRMRSISVGSEHLHGSAMFESAEQGSSSGESEADRDMEREFETEYQEVKRERITRLTKSELEQELLEKECDIETLYDRCERIQEENEKIKAYALANGLQLPIPDPSASSTSPRVTAV